MSTQRFQANNAKRDFALAKLEEWQLLFGTRKATAKLDSGDSDPEAAAVDEIIKNGLPKTLPTRKRKPKTKKKTAAAPASGSSAAASAGGSCDEATAGEAKSEEVLTLEDREGPQTKRAVPVVEMATVVVKIRILI